MNLNLKKNPVVGISVNPEKGLEVIQVDFEHRKIVKYGRKDLEYDINNQEIADLDYFKETLHDLLTELNIPKGTKLVLNIPPMMFKVADYPTALTETQIVDSISEDLSENPMFKDVDITMGIAPSGNSTLQSKRFVSAVSRKTMLIEIAMQIKELGYTLVAIDVSVNSILNALIYNNRIDYTSDSIWLLLIIEKNCCRLLSMQGKDYIDCYEEKFVIGEVLGEEENYRTVVETVNPLLNNLPSQYLFVVSNTDLISAEKLASKMTYTSTIVHCESNNYAATPLLEIDESFSEDIAKGISVDTIGAGIKCCLEGFECNINLFNEYLGSVYLSEKPLEITFNGKRYPLSVERMLALSSITAIIVIIVGVFAYITLSGLLLQKKGELKRLKDEIETMETILKQNKDVSSEIFDEDSEIRSGLSQNKQIYSYYTIVGTEIPQKLWLTKLMFDGNITTIEGQSDNLESIYAFFRNIKDYDTDSDVKLQKLELASRSKGSITTEAMDTDSLLTSVTADFYQFKISNASEEVKEKDDEKDKDNSADNNPNTTSSSKKNSGEKKGTNVPKFLPSTLETAD